jgi:radical SAM protein with 4Fe4S-binding SPASM domain
VLSRLERHAEAAEVFKRCIEDEPHEPMHYRNHADDLIRLGRFEEAEQDLKMATGLDPGNKHLHARYGQLFVEKGEYEKSFVDSMPCYIGWTYSRVTTDGNVIPCCKGYGKPLGNLEQAAGGFAAVWNSPNLQNFRQLASTQKKDHPYFNPINCVKCCDNVGMNLAMHRKVTALSTDERARLARLYEQSGARPTRARLLPDDTNAFPDPFAASELVGHSEVRAAQRNNSAAEPEGGEAPADDAGLGCSEGYASDSPAAPVLDPDAANRIALRFK